MEKLGNWSVGNFLLQQQNTPTYSCLTGTKQHAHVVNSIAILVIFILRWNDKNAKSGPDFKKQVTALRVVMMVECTSTYRCRNY